MQNFEPSTNSVESVRYVQFGIAFLKRVARLNPGALLVKTPDLYRSESAERTRLLLQRRMVPLCQACQDLVRVLQDLCHVRPRSKLTTSKRAVMGTRMISRSQHITD